LNPGPAAKSQVAVGSAVFSSAGKSKSPIWLVNAASTVADSRILTPSGEVPLPSSIR